MVEPPYLSPSSIGFELNDGFKIHGQSFSLAADDPINGIDKTDAYIEISTYAVPDTIIITAYDVAGNATEILNICKISTYIAQDPTNGTYRPFSDAILQFNVVLPAGTTLLTFDYRGSHSPTYLGMWNLNGFSAALYDPTSNPFYGEAHPQYFRVQRAPLDIYNNESKDPLKKKRSCPNI